MINWQTLPCSFLDIPDYCPRGLPSSEHIETAWLAAQERKRSVFHPVLRCLGIEAGAPPTSYQWALGQFDAATGELILVWQLDGDGVLRRYDAITTPIVRPNALLRQPC